MALINKYPVTVGIGTYLQPLRRYSFQHIDPGGGNLRDHRCPVFAQHDGLQAYAVAAMPSLSHHRRQRQKGIQFLDLSIGNSLPGSNSLEHLAQQGPQCAQHRYRQRIRSRGNRQMPVLGKSRHPLWICKIVLHTLSTPTVEMLAIDQIEAKLAFADQLNLLMPCCGLLPGECVLLTLLVVFALTDGLLLALRLLLRSVRQNVMV